VSDTGDKRPEDFPEVTPGTERDATDRGEGTTLPVHPDQLQPEVVGVRHGMFGAQGSGDTSGYGGLVRQVAMPGGTVRPYGGWFDEVADTLSAGIATLGLPEAVEKVVVHRGEVTFFLRRAGLLEVARLLRDELHAVYHLLSMTHNRRIRLEVTCPDADPHIPSVVAVYPTADWHERETYDFFGIIFDGHPALTRIEMPDDWPGHPQRKDYPLGGIPVEYKGATIPPPDTRRSYS
jgi:NADH-quinone oxidoreductase subunit C